MISPAAVVLVLAVSAVETRVDAVVRAEMERARIPGVAVAVVRGPETLLARGYGLANVEHGVAVTPETVFQSGSLGKMFTAALVMALVEDGRLSLDATLGGFFPEAPEWLRAVTVRQLLTHTSGLPDYTTDSMDYRRDYTEEELARLAFGLTPEFAPGTRWSYSNTGYVLLGIVAGKVGGRFYGDLLRERIFVPAGMATARIITEEDIVPHRAAGYRLVDGQLKNQEWVAPRLNTTADGSLYFTLKDLLAWDRVVRRRALLRPASWEAILTPVRLASGKTYPYGFGWGIDERAGRPLHAHGGSWQGFKTHYARYFATDLSVIVLANLAQADPGRIADAVAAAVDPALAVPEPRPIAAAEPAVTARLRRLLQEAAAGRLQREELAYVRAGFFPGGATALAARLEGLGDPSRIDLLRREEIGDDRVYTYDVTYGSAVFRVTLALAPDDRVSSFAVRDR